MNTTHTPSSTKPTVPLLEPDEYHQFILKRPAEILMVMREMCDSATQITVFFNAGRDMLLTKPLACDSDQLVLDCGPDATLNRRATQATEFNCVTFPSRIRVQFALRSLALVEQDGHYAFRTAMPVEILRLQRREYYRLTTSSTRPLKSLIPLPLPDGGVHLHIGHLFDISGGGMGITAPAEEMPFAVGMEFPNCRIDLPEVGVVTCALRICTIFGVTLKNGTRIRRAGCEFVNLSGQMGNLIQRYIIKAERERKALERASG